MVRKEAPELEGPTAPPEHSRRPVTARAVLLGLLFSLALGAITPTNDFALGNTFIAGNHFPLGAFIVLLVLAVPVNLLLRGTHIVRPLRTGELVTVWCMILVSSGIPSSGLVRLLVPVPVGYNYFADPTNEWHKHLDEQMPSWMVLPEGDASEWFFEGKPDNAAIPWRAWISPTVGYGAFTLLFYLTTVCLASLLRRQWEDRERFTFPLVDLPLELAAASDSAHPSRFPFLTSGAFWGTVVVVVLLHSLNGLNRFYPSLPVFPFHADLGPYLTEPPWRYLWWFVLNTYPMMVGIAFFARTEVTFSIWFFYLIRRIQEAAFSFYGLPAGPALLGWGPNFVLFQEIGAYVGMFLWMMWIARDHFRGVWRKVFHGGELDDRDEPMAYRLALPGLLLGLIGCVAWLKIAGVTLIPAVVSVIALFGTCLVLAWLVNNGGTIFVQNRFSPIDILMGMTGTKGPIGSRLFTPRTLAALPVWDIMFARDLREIMLPSLLNTSRAATPYVNRRQMLLAVLLSASVVLVLSYILAVRVGYVWAAGVLPDTWAYVSCTHSPYDHGTRLIRDGVTFDDHSNLRNLLIGIAVTLGLSIVRAQYPRFGLHPAGLCLAATYAGDQIFFSMFLAWVLKTVLMRIGGFKAMRTARPFVYGLVIGDALAALIWIIHGWHIADPTRRYYILPP